MTTTTGYSITVGQGLIDADADSMHAAVDAARMLCEHYGAAKATIYDPEGWEHTFYAERVEEDKDPVLTIDYAGDTDGAFASIMLRALDGFTVTITVEGETYRNVELDVVEVGPVGSKAPTHTVARMIDAETGKRITHFDPTEANVSYVRID